MLGSEGSRRESQARAAIDAADGPGGDLSQAADDGRDAGTQDLPVFAAGSWRSSGADQVWSADITYVPMPTGFMYLTAVMDWYSRYVLAWRLSNTLDGGFCVEALEEALRARRPEIFNTDQGVQFTAWRSRVVWSRRGWRSAWTAAAGRWTTCSSSGCGGP